MPLPSKKDKSVTVDLRLTQDAVIRCQEPISSDIDCKPQSWSLQLTSWSDFFGSSWLATLSAQCHILGSKVSLEVIGGHLDDLSEQCWMMDTSDMKDSKNVIIIQGPKCGHNNVQWRSLWPVPYRKSDFRIKTTNLQWKSLIKSCTSVKKQAFIHLLNPLKMKIHYIYSENIGILLIDKWIDT